MAGWADVLAGAGPTCLPSNGLPSRIDYVLASRPAMAMIRRAALRWDLGLATHAALVLDLDVEAVECTWMRTPVTPLDGPQAPGWAQERSAATADVLARHAGSFRRAAAEGDLDEAWAELELALREWLTWRRGVDAVPARPLAHARWRAERPRTLGRDGQAECREADEALLRCRRLCAFKHACGLGAAARGGLPVAGCMPHPARCILDALRRADDADPDWTQAWAELERRPATALPPLVQRAELHLAAATRRSRETRRAAWQKWVDDALGDGCGRLYRWIRGGALSAAALAPDPGAAPAADVPADVQPPAAAPAAAQALAKPGCKRWLLALRGGPAAQLRHLEAHWRPLWQRPPVAAVPEEWLAELDGLPAFPQLEAWTAAHLRHLLRSMSRRKAVGLDGWSVAELRLLPD
eukprot:16452349-Heterocapsa_arctica.AAC.1